MQQIWHGHVRRFRRNTTAVTRMVGENNTTLSFR